MPEQSVTILVSKARSGDGQAFGALYELFYKPLYRFIAARVSSRYDAEDLAQVVFMKALESLDRYEERNTFHSWLYAIARNSIIDHFKKKKSRIVTDEELLHLAASDPDPAQAAESAELAREVRAGLAKLKPEYREAIELRFLSELSTAEIAARLGLSEDNVRQRQSRGLKELRKIFNGYHH